jgi:hypothetical protein
MKRIAGLTLVLLSFVIVLVSAFVYEQQSNTVTQTITEIASITLDQAALGDIEEGETILYTPTNTSAIDQILDVTTGKDGVYLYFETDLDSQSSNYDTYQIEVIVDTAPGGSGVSGTIETLTIGSPNSASGIALDLEGDWVFDFQVTTTAQLVDSDTPTTVNIDVFAQSTA